MYLEMVMTEWDCALEVRAEILGVDVDLVKKAVMRKMMLNQSEDAMEAVMTLELQDLCVKKPQ